MNKSASILNVGSAIREKRKVLNLTLKGLAEQTGLSVAYISQVERSNTIPSLMSLYQIAEVLDVPMDNLIKTSKSFKTYRKGTELEKLPVVSDTTWFILSNPFPNKKIDPLLWLIPAGYKPSKVQGERTQGEGFLYILSGTLSINYHGNDFELETDDSMHYDLEHTLTVSNKTDSPVKSLWVGTVILE